MSVMQFRKPEKPRKISEDELHALIDRSDSAVVAIRSILDMLGNDSVAETTLARVVVGYLADHYCHEHLAQARDEMVESIDDEIGELLED